MYEGEYQRTGKGISSNRSDAKLFHINLYQIERIYGGHDLGFPDLPPLTSSLILPSLISGLNVKQRPLMQRVFVCKH